MARTRISQWSVVEPCPLAKGGFIAEIVRWQSAKIARRTDPQTLIARRRRHDALRRSEQDEEQCSGFLRRSRLAPLNDVLRRDQPIAPVHDADRHLPAVSYTSAISRRPVPRSCHVCQKCAKASGSGHGKNNDTQPLSLGRRISRPTVGVPGGKLKPFWPTIPSKPSVSPATSRIHTPLGLRNSGPFCGPMLLLCCRHQPESTRQCATIRLEGGTILVSGSRLLFVKTTNAARTRSKDLDAMEFVVENYKSPNLESAFFPLREDDASRGNRRCQLHLFGFPTELRSVDNELSRHVHGRTSAEYNGASHARYLHSLNISWQDEFRPFWG